MIGMLDGCSARVREIMEEQRQLAEEARMAADALEAHHNRASLEWARRPLPTLGRPGAG